MSRHAPRGGSIMVLTAFKKGAKSELALVDVRMNAQNILEEHLQPFITIEQKEDRIKRLKWSALHTDPNLVVQHILNILIIVAICTYYTCTKI